METWCVVRSSKRIVVQCNSLDYRQCWHFTRIFRCLFWRRRVPRLGNLITHVYLCNCHNQETELVHHHRGTSSFYPLRVKSSVQSRFLAIAGLSPTTMTASFGEYYTSRIARGVTVSRLSCSVCTMTLETMQVFISRAQSFFLLSGFSVAACTLVCFCIHPFKNI